jgi:hypothetical protein
MNHYATFVKKGYMTLIADNEIVETRYFDKRTKYTQQLNYFKKRIEKSGKICEISIIYDNIEINKTLERIENYTDKRTLKKNKNIIFTNT